MCASELLPASARWRSGRVHHRTASIVVGISVARPLSRRMQQSKVKLYLSPHILVRMYPLAVILLTVIPLIKKSSESVKISLLL